MEKKKPSSKKSNPQNLKPLISLLKKGGFVVPTTEQEIQEYDRIHLKTDIILPHEVDSPDFLFEGKPNETVFDDTVNISETPNIVKAISFSSVKHDSTTAKQTIPKKNDYFKKLVLAAEIANELHAEPTFGHTKFVKVYYICNHVCNMRLSVKYGKYVAGPLDPKHLYSVDAQFVNRKWFTIKKRDKGLGYKYFPAENINQYKQYYPMYFKNESDSISHIIDLFRKKNSNFCEIVATLFFIWDRENSNSRKIDDGVLITEFYNWGEEKKRFKENELKGALTWMKKEKIVPIV